MNRFLLVALLLLLVALSMVVGAFLYVQFLLVSETPATSNEAVGVGEVVKLSVGVDTAVVSADAAPETPTPAPTQTQSEPKVVLDTSIPLSSLPLSETQKSLLETVGVDYDTFIITPEMIRCAEGKLGVERFNAIVEGGSPSGFETMSLLRCL